MPALGTKDVGFAAGRARLGDQPFFRAPRNDLLTSATIYETVSDM